MRKFNLDKEEIKRLYLEEKKSSSYIAKIYNCDKTVILNRLKEWGIKVRGSRIRNKVCLNDNEIKRLYLEENKSSTEIAKIMNCDCKTILRRLKKIGVKINQRSMRKAKRIYDKLNKKKRIGKLELLKEEIINLYNQNTPSEKIAKRLNVGSTSILRNLRKWGIKIKESKEYLIGNIPSNKINLEYYKEEIINLYNQGFDTRFIGNKFNIDKSVILNRLHTWKIQLRRPKHGKKFITDSGYSVQSSSELYISNWLFHNKIFHIYNKKIGFGNYRCDFYISDVNLYIEFFGLMDVKFYRERTKKKLEAYKQLGLNLLPIFPKDNIQQKLSFLLQYSQNQTKLTEFT